MDIKSIHAEFLKQDKSRVKFYFEILLHDLIKIHSKKQSKKYISGCSIRVNRNIVFFDGFAEDGIDDLKGPVAFEYKYKISSIPKEFYSRVEKMLTKKSIEYLIIICPEKINENLKKQKELNEKIIFWGDEEINKLINQNTLEVNNIISNIFKLDLQNTIHSQKNNKETWQESRIKCIENIRQQYRKGKISLFLGAGVSCSVGFPDWNTLLNSLYTNFVNRVVDNSTTSNSTKKYIISNFTNINGGSALSAARYLKEGLSRYKTNSDFIDLIKESLYKVKPTQSPLIIAIVNLCKSRRGNMPIKSIVTYNFDDYLEKSINDAGLNYALICNDEDESETQGLSIYHVHGFIPKDDVVDKKISFIFSEEAYHKVYSEPYHWSNLVQLSMLREKSCLMIGLSMNDPNLRRLLEIASQNNKKNHYVFLKRLKTEDFSKTRSKTRINKDSVNNIINAHHVVQENMMSSFGINIIWYEDYDEIPKLINEIGK